MQQRTLRQQARANQLQFRSQIQAVEMWFESRDIPISTDVWIYPDYPDGYHAVCGAWDRVWIFEFYRGWLQIYDVQKVQGFNPNGTLRFDIEADWH